MLPLRVARPISVARLITQHGPDMGLPELRIIIAADCPHMVSADPYDRCGVVFPQSETRG